MGQTLWKRKDARWQFSKTRQYPPPLNKKRYYNSIGYKYCESGRSLVEMLGVLAVMGIIGLASVKIYTSSMTQHRANELINEAQKRAVMVAAQIMAGVEDLSVAEFKNPEGYTFGVEKNPANPNQFNIIVNRVDVEVCQKIKTMIAEGTTIRLVSEQCNKLTFNNDLSVTIYPSDYPYNECPNEFYQCATNTTCVKDIDHCPPRCSEYGASASNSDSYTGGSFFPTRADKTIVCYCPTGKKYNKNTSACDTDITNTCTSWTSNECGAGYYCQFNGLNCYTGPTQAGTCTPLSACRMYDITITNGETSTTYRSGDPTSDCRTDWWTDQAICAAEGMQLISLSDLGCEAKEGQNCTSTMVSKLRAAGWHNGTFMIDKSPEHGCSAWWTYITPVQLHSGNRSLSRNGPLCRPLT